MKFDSGSMKSSTQTTSQVDESQKDNAVVLSQNMHEQRNYFETPIIKLDPNFGPSNYMILPEIDQK